MIRHRMASSYPIDIKKNVTTCDHPTWLGPAAWAGCATVGASGLRFGMARSHETTTRRAYGRPRLLGPCSEEHWHGMEGHALTAA